MKTLRHIDDIGPDELVLVTDGEPWGATTHVHGCPAIPTEGTCVEVRMADADGWIDSCIDVDPRHRKNPAAVVDSATQQSYGAGMTNTATATETAAPRWVKVGDDFAVAAPGHTTGDTVTVTAKSGRVSEVTLGAKVKADTYLPAKPEAPTTYRWTKQGDEWLVTGPTAERGDRIAIAKKDGSTVEAIVTGFAGTDLYRVEKAEASTAPVNGRIPTAEQVPEGHYALPSTGHNDLVFYRVDRPTDGEYAGRVFVKMIVGGKPESRVQWSKVPGILARIAEAGADEAMALYGREIGRCGVCNRTLTDETSRARGIGPDCYSRMS